MTHDVVVGAGVTGSLIAQRLTRAGLRVFVLEAGPPARGAPQPDTRDLRSDDGYFVQRGPLKYGSTYTRFQGGSTLHWLGVCLRMLPEDFELRSRYGRGREWPLGYQALEPWYRQAERAIGVAADVAEQTYHGIEFAAGYDYPMRRIPSSYSDTVLAAAIDGMPVRLGEDEIRLKVRSYPAARNSVPREGCRPVGAVDIRPEGQGLDPYLGERCAGNTSCTPICPIQAKYIDDLRGGAFRVDIGNDGWRPTTGAPDTTVVDAVETRGLYGVDFRRYLGSTLSRQVRFSINVEQLPSPSNRVTIDPRYLDALGTPRPVISYDIDDYTLAGMAEATRVYREVFSRNLFLVGAGSFPTMDTSNPTLTMAALALRTADRLTEELRR